MNGYFKLAKPAVKLINLTENTIQVYDECSGDIVTIPPEVHVLPEHPEPINADKPSYYVFEETTANRLEENGRLLNDVAIIHRKSVGRDGITISSLIWGGNHSTSVGFCRNYNRQLI